MAHYSETLNNGPVKQQFHLERDGGKDTIVFHSSQETQPILDEVAKYAQLMEVRGQFRKYRMAAKIPIVVYYAWRREWREKHSDTFTWNTYKAMKLNSRDYSALRVGGKKI